jgi:hypothetical protein
MKYLVTLTIFFTLLVPVVFSLDQGLVPSEATAAGLVPCGGNGEPACQSCHVITLANNVITWLITFLSVVAVMAIVYNGFQLVTSQGDTSRWTNAKKMFVNIVIGIILILAAWLIVDTILKGLTGQGLTGFSSVQCIDPPSSAQNSSGSNNTSSQESSVGNGESYTDSEARSTLSAAGINVNKTQAQGTSLEGINKATVADAVALKQACNCAITITGGTESGHSGGTYSHGSGYKYDIRLDSGINSYITNNFTQSGTRSDGAVLYTSPEGNVYAREGDHWDVLVK